MRQRDVEGAGNLAVLALLDLLRRVPEPRPVLHPLGRIGRRAYLRVLDAAAAGVVEGFAQALILKDDAGPVGCRRNDALAFAPADELGGEMVIRHRSPARDRAAEALRLIQRGNAGRGCRGAEALAREVSEGQGPSESWSSGESAGRGCRGADPLTLGVLGEQGSPTLGVPREQGSLALGLGSKAPERTRCPWQRISAHLPCFVTSLSRLR